MKQFFEQYGGVALGILALLVLIAIITPVGNIIKTSLQSTVHTTAAGIESQTDTMTESMNAAFTNAVDFTGAKGGKYYVHGQIVADTVLPDGTNRGTEGWRLTEKQYQLMEENVDLLMNGEYAVIFHNFDDAAWIWCYSVYIFNTNDQNDYYVAFEQTHGYNYDYNHLLTDFSNPIQFRYASAIITLKSNVNTQVSGYSGGYTNLTYYETADVPVTSLCETLNLGCEVGA